LVDLYKKKMIVLKDAKKAGGNIQFEANVFTFEYV